MKMQFVNRLVVVVICVFCACSCAVSKYASNSDYPTPKTTYSPEGTLREVFYTSSEPSMTSRRAYVYLPKGYETSSKSYPVLYLLHGARGNELVWIDKANILRDIDSLTACGAMLPSIVVFPNMNQYKSAADYGNARLKGALESFYEIDGVVESRFLSDVVTQTDKMFRTVPEKNSRAVAGLSIGAMQAIHLSANFPDTFGYVGMFSPMVHSVFVKHTSDNSFYKGLRKKQRLQFAESPELYIMMIGHRDFFYPTVKRYSRSLDKRGYDHEVKYVSGGHEWTNWRAFCDEFLTRLWK